MSYSAIPESPIADPSLMYSAQNNYENLKNADESRNEDLYSVYNRLYSYAKHQMKNKTTNSNIPKPKPLA
jgi:bisphosphoglycerate-dependent phosphoglycerate mutase